MGLTLLWLLVITSSPLPNALIASLEDPYPVFRWYDHPNLKKANPYIVVLGAGHTYDSTLLPIHQLSGRVRGRLLEAYRLYRNTENAHIVTSGPDAYYRSRSQGKALANSAVQLGVDPADTSYISNGYNTRTEAKWFSKRFPDQDTVIIATDAIHMRRACFWFRHYGVEPSPAPTNFMIKRDPYDPDKPFISFSRSNIDRLGKAFKEYVGYWYGLWYARRH